MPKERTLDDVFNDWYKSLKPEVADMCRRALQGDEPDPDKYPLVYLLLFKLNVLSLQFLDGEIQALKKRLA